MRILMVSSFLPYPLFSGGHVRLFNLIKELSSKHEITLICEKRPNQTDYDIEEIKKICKKVITVKRRNQWSTGNLLSSLSSSNSFLATGHKNQKMRDEIEKELENGKYDLIHVETYYIFQNLPAVSIPVVLAEHNIEYQVYGLFAQKTNPLIKPLLMRDVAKIKIEEENSWKKASKLVTVSKDDQAVAAKSGINSIIVANGVDTEKFSFKSHAKSQKSEVRKILFMGDFKWIQNRDSIKFIIEEIWPILRQGFGGQVINSQRNSLKLWIVGRNIPESIRSLSHDSNIVFDENSSAKPTEQIFQEADILLAPIRVGGGTSYKILESMSCGTPVVTMQRSAESIEAKDDYDIFTSETASGLAEKVVKLLQDENLYKKISVNGRKLIEQKYTWKKIGNDLERVYADLSFKI